MRLSQRHHVYCQRLNWTFMELKYGLACSNASPSRSLNWTFMELKSACCLHLRSSLRSVWIEPLWNWNRCISQKYTIILQGLNWTFMELKCLGGRLEICGRLFELNLYGIEMVLSVMVAACKVVWIEPLWNWNCGHCYECVQHSGLNWTFMELKSLFVQIGKIFTVVWIEPLWNWN